MPTQNASNISIAVPSGIKISCALELLGFKPETEIREGLEETITWFTKQQSS